MSSSKPVVVAPVQLYLEQPPTPSDLQAVVPQQANTYQEAVGEGVDIVEKPQKKVTGLMEERKRSGEAALPLRDLSMKEIVGYASDGGSGGAVQSSVVCSDGAKLEKKRIEFEKKEQEANLKKKKKEAELVKQEKAKFARSRCEAVAEELVSPKQVRVF